MAIYDTMQSLKSPVGTHCVGYAYNLAGFLLAAGEKVYSLWILYIYLDIITILTPSSKQTWNYKIGT